MEVTLVGGPLNGQIIEVEKGETHEVQLQDDKGVNHSYVRPCPPEKEEDLAVWTASNKMRYGGIVKP